MAKKIKISNMCPLCPVCGSLAEVESFGPFFTPEPKWRFARHCKGKCWRGPMCATKEEAETCKQVPKF